jgi:hypothetical protein
MTDFTLRKVVFGADEIKYNPYRFSIRENNITIVQISGEKYAEMESWLTEHGATIIGYSNGLEFCPVYYVTDEVKVLFALRWS